MSVISLNSRLLICKPTLKETNLINKYETYDKSDALNSWKHIIKCEDEESLHIALTTLRIFKDNLIGTGNRYYINKEKFSGMINEERLFNTLDENETKYNLKKTDIAKLLELFNTINKFDFHNNIRIQEAINRLYKIYYDALMHLPIDIMIGLEALYLNDAQEMTYKLGLRVAYLLGNTYEERKTIYDTIREAYKIRSSIVHGVDCFMRPMAEEKFVNSVLAIISTKKILRESIKKFFMLIEFNTHTELIDILDEKILQGSNS